MGDRSTGLILLRDPIAGSSHLIERKGFTRRTIMKLVKFDDRKKLLYEK